MVQWLRWASHEHEMCCLWLEILGSNPMTLKTWMVLLFLEQNKTTCKAEWTVQWLYRGSKHSTCAAKNAVEQLNGHLYNLHVIDSPKCSCSYKCEDSNRYVFIALCMPLNAVKMLNTVNKLCSGNVDLNLLLHGRQTLDYWQNKNIIESVELYILETKRLL